MPTQRQPVHGTPNNYYYIVLWLDTVTLNSNNFDVCVCVCVQYDGTTMRWARVKAILRVGLIKQNV